MNNSNQESKIIFVSKEKWKEIIGEKELLEDYTIKILEKHQNPLKIIASMVKKSNRNINYTITLGIQKNLLFMTCNCPFFLKKIIPNALKYGTEIKLEGIEGLFIGKSVNNFPIDKHCRILIDYLNLV